MSKPILIIQNHPVESAGTILDWLTDRALAYSVVHTYKDQPLPAISEIDAAIGLGCPHSVLRYREHAYLRNLHAWLAESVRDDKPFLGLCFSGQMLASILGARVETGKSQEIGIFNVELTDEGADDPLFAGFDRKLPVFQWHNDTFRTPFGASHLVRGGLWKHQGYRKGRQIGLQFHLEARPEDIPAWCDAYADELESAGLNRDGIISDFNAVSPQVHDLTYRLLDNWLG